MGDYKKLLNKKKKKYCDISTMGVNIDKNEFYEIVQSNSAHPEKLNPKNGWGSYDGLLELFRDIRNVCESNPDGIFEIN